MRLNFFDCVPRSSVSGSASVSNLYMSTRDAAKANPPQKSVVIASAGSNGSSSRLMVYAQIKQMAERVM